VKCKTRAAWRQGHGGQAGENSEKTAKKKRTLECASIWFTFPAARSCRQHHVKRVSPPNFFPVKLSDVLVVPATYLFSASPQHVSGSPSKRTIVVLKVLHHNASAYEKHRFLYTFTEYISGISSKKPTESVLNRHFIAGKKFDS
jgi:hypothetical protein